MLDFYGIRLFSVVGDRPRRRPDLLRVFPSIFGEVFRIRLCSRRPGVLRRQKELNKVKSGKSSGRVRANRRRLHGLLSYKGGARTGARESP
jgi:hypothetical protein